MVVIKTTLEEQNNYTSEIKKIFTLNNFLKYNFLYVFYKKRKEMQIMSLLINKIIQYLSMEKLVGKGKKTKIEHKEKIQFVPSLELMNIK
jgi:hypothetical protein